MQKNSQIIERINQNPPFFSEEREKVLLRKRLHWFMLILPVFLAVVYFVILEAFVSTIFTVFIPNFNLAIITSLVLFLAATSIIAKIIIDWHCHFYILTNHRILEVYYKPLFSNHINNVILSQVKSTEIDIEKNGLINQLIDMGDVLVTFDRPTHQEQFCLINIKDPRSVGFLLADALDLEKPKDIMDSPVWSKSKDKDRPFNITEEIFPNTVFGVN